MSGSLCQANGGLMHSWDCLQSQFLSVSPANIPSLSTSQYWVSAAMATVEAAQNLKLTQRDISFDSQDFRQAQAKLFRSKCQNNYAKDLLSRPYAPTSSFLVCVKSAPCKARQLQAKVVHWQPGITMKLSTTLHGAVGADSQVPHASQ